MNKEDIALVVLLGGSVFAAFNATSWWKLALPVVFGLLVLNALLRGGQ